MANAGKRLPPGIPEEFEEFRTVCPITCGCGCGDLPPLSSLRLQAGQNGADCFDNDVLISSMLKGYTCIDVLALQGMTACAEDSQSVLSSLGVQRKDMVFVAGDSSKPLSAHCPVSCHTCPSSLLAQEEEIASSVTSSVTLAPVAPLIGRHASPYIATSVYRSSLSSQLRLPHGSTATVTCAGGYSNAAKQNNALIVGSDGSSQSVRTEASDGDGTGVTDEVTSETHDSLTCHEGAWTPRTLYCSQECPPLNSFGSAYQIEGDNLDNRHGAVRTVRCAVGTSSVDGMNEQVIRCLDGAWSDLVMDCRRNCDEAERPSGSTAGLVSRFYSEGVNQKDEDLKKTSHGAKWIYECNGSAYSPEPLSIAVAHSDVEEINEFKSVGGSPLIESDKQLIMCHDGRWTPLTLSCHLRCTTGTPLPNILRFRYSFIEGFSGLNRTQQALLDKKIIKIDPESENEVVLDPDALSDFWKSYTVNGANHRDYLMISCREGYTAATASSSLPPSLRVSEEKLECRDGLWNEQTLVCTKSCDEYFFSDDDPKKDPSRYLIFSTPDSAQYPSAKKVPHGSRRVFKCNEELFYYSQTAATISYATCIDGEWLKPGLICKKSCNTPTPIQEKFITSPVNTFPPYGYCVWDITRSKCAAPHDLLVDVSGQAAKKLRDGVPLDDADVKLKRPLHGESIWINCAPQFSPVSGSTPALSACSDGLFTPFYLICAPNCVAENVKIGDGYRIVKTYTVDALLNGYTVNEHQQVVVDGNKQVFSGDHNARRNQNSALIQLLSPEMKKIHKHSFSSSPSSSIASDPISGASSSDPFASQRTVIYASQLHATLVASRDSKSTVSRLSHSIHDNLMNADLQTELAAVRLSQALSALKRSKSVSGDQFDGNASALIHMASDEKKSDDDDVIVSKLMSLRENSQLFFSPSLKRFSSSTQPHTSFLQISPQQLKFNQERLPSSSDGSDLSLEITDPQIRNIQKSKEELEELLTQIKSSPSELPAFHAYLVNSAKDRLEHSEQRETAYMKYEGRLPKPSNKTESGLTKFPTTHGTRLVYECESWAAPLPGTEFGNTSECFWGEWTTLPLRCVSKCNVGAIQQLLTVPSMAGRYEISFQDESRTLSELPGGIVDIFCTANHTRWPPINALEDNPPAQMICSGGKYGSIPINCYRSCQRHPYESIAGYNVLQKNSPEGRRAIRGSMAMLMNDEVFLRDLKKKIDMMDLKKWMEVTDGGYSLHSKLMLEFEEIQDPKERSFALEKLKLSAAGMKEKQLSLSDVEISSRRSEFDSLFNSIFNQTVSSRRYALSKIEQTAEDLPHGAHASSVLITCASGFTLSLPSVYESPTFSPAVPVFSTCMDGHWMGGEIKCLSDCPLPSNPDPKRYVLHHPDPQLKADYEEFLASAGDQLSAPSSTFTRPHGFSVSWACTHGTKPIYTQTKTFESATAAHGSQDLKCVNGVFEPLTLICEKPCRNPLESFRDEKWSLRDLESDLPMAETTLFPSRSRVWLSCNSQQLYFDVSSIYPGREEEVECVNGEWQTSTLQCFKSCAPFGNDFNTMNYATVEQGYSSYAVRPPVYWTSYNSSTEIQQSSFSIQNVLEYRLHGAMRLLSCTANSSPMSISYRLEKDEPEQRQVFEGDDIPLFSKKSSIVPKKREQKKPKKDKKVPLPEKKLLEKLEKLMLEQAMMASATNATSELAEKIKSADQVSALASSISFRKTGEDAIVCRNGKWVGRQLVCKRRCGEFVHPSNLDKSGEVRYAVKKLAFKADQKESAASIQKIDFSDERIVLDVPQKSAITTLLVPHGSIRIVTCAPGYAQPKASFSTFWSADGEEFTTSMCVDGLWTTPDFNCQKRCSEPYNNVLHEKCKKYHKLSPNSPCAVASGDLSISRELCSFAMCDEPGGPWLGDKMEVKGVSPYVIFKTIMRADKKALRDGVKLESDIRKLAALATRPGTSHVVMCNSKNQYAPVISDSESGSLFSSTGSLLKEVAVVTCLNGEWSQLPFECDKGCHGSFDLYSHPKHWLPFFTNDLGYYSCTSKPYDYSASEFAHKFDMYEPLGKKLHGSLGGVAGKEFEKSPALGMVQSVSCDKWLNTESDRTPNQVRVESLRKNPDAFNDKERGTPKEKLVTFERPSFGYRWPLGEHWAIWGPGCCNPGNCWAGVDEQSDRGKQCKQRVYGRGSWVAFEVLTKGMKVPGRDVFYAKCDVGVVQPQPVFDFVGKKNALEAFERYDVLASYPQTDIVSDTSGQKWKWSMPFIPFRYFMQNRSENSTSSVENPVSKKPLTVAAARKAADEFDIEQLRIMTEAQRNVLFGAHSKNIQSKLGKTASLSCPQGLNIIILEVRVGQPGTIYTPGFSDRVSKNTPLNVISLACNLSSKCDVDLSADGLEIPAHGKVAGTATNNTNAETKKSEQVAVTEPKNIVKAKYKSSFVGQADVAINYLCTSGQTAMTILKTSQSAEGQDLNLLSPTEDETLVVKTVAEVKGGASTESNGQEKKK